MSAGAAEVQSITIYHVSTPAQVGVVRPRSYQTIAIYNVPPPGRVGVGAHELAKVALFTMPSPPARSRVVPRLDE